MLTTAQLTTIKAHILASPDMNGQPMNSEGAFEIARLFNLQASPAFTVWRSNVSANEIGNAWSGTDIDGMSALNMQRLQLLLASPQKGAPLTTLESLIFAVLLVCALGFFLRNVFRLFSIICLGQWDNRFDYLWTRLKGMFLYAFLQLRVVSEKFGVNHFFLFWGFMVLLLANMQFFIAGVFPSFSFEFLGTIPYGILLLLADIMSLVVLTCVVIAAIRRIFFRPPHVEATLDALSPDGRFVELSKRDVWPAQRMQAERPDVDYHVLGLEAG